MTTFLAGYLFFLLFFAYTKPEFLGINKQVNAQVPTPTPAQQLPTALLHGLPVRLVIPAIHVDASIIPMGIEKDGSMEVPDSIIKVGWYKFGTLPGNDGAAVLAGHVDGKNGEPGVFADLGKLQAGDSISIEDEFGNINAFTVRQHKNYDPSADTLEIFDNQNGAHLNLITCEGVWDQKLQTYNKRLVIFADSVKE